MKYHKKLDDNTWVTFDEGEDMEWGEQIKTLIALIVICGTLGGLIGFVCWLMEFSC